MGRFVLAIDAGTTSVRSMAFGKDGHAIASSQRPIRQIYPGDGMVEHDALEIRDAVIATLRECLEMTGMDVSECDCIGMTNQRETTVVWDRRTGIPVHNAIVWQDRRTAGMCSAISELGYGEYILQRPDCRWTRTSPGRRSDGSWTTSAVRPKHPEEATCCSAPWTHG